MAKVLINSELRKENHIFLRTFRCLNREICRNLDKKVRLRQIFMTFLFNYLSTVEETLFLFIDLHFRKGLKILETGIAPFLCILQLYIEQRVCMLPFLFMSLHILLG